MDKQVPIDFTNDYFLSRHYEPGDEVYDIEAGYHENLGYTYMNLIIRDNQGQDFRLPFYFNQMPDEPNGDYMTEKEEIELDVDAWIESMAGATEWTEWYDNVELEEI